MDITFIYNFTTLPKTTVKLNEKQSFSVILSLMKSVLSRYPFRIENRLALLNTKFPKSKAHNRNKSLALTNISKKSPPNLFGSSIFAKTNKEKRSKSPILKRIQEFINKGRIETLSGKYERSNYCKK
jgi:hypothetical protein